MINKTKRTSIGKKKVALSTGLSRQGKMLLVAICTAVLIGFALGMISLQMTKQETTVHQDETFYSAEEVEEGAEMKETAGFSFFVVQGGVFNELENANKWAEEFKQHDYPTFNWQKDSEVFLLTGIASEQAVADKLADQMKKDELDVYVKEWEINAVQSPLSEAEHEWLDQFLSLWKESVKMADKKDEIPQEDWEKLIDKKVTTDSSLQVIEELQQQIHESTPITETALFEMIYTYDRAF